MSKGKLEKKKEKNVYQDILKNLFWHLFLSSSRLRQDISLTSDMVLSTIKHISCMDKLVSCSSHAKFCLSVTQHNSSPARYIWHNFFISHSERKKILTTSSASVFNRSIGKISYKQEHYYNCSSQQHEWKCQSICLNNRKK